MGIPSDEFVRCCRIVKIVDGDTLRLQIDLGFGATIIHDIRLARVNTPEHRGSERAAGRYVSQEVIKWVGPITEAEVLIHSKAFKLGKFGRCICEAWVNGENLNDMLLSRRLAWRTDEAGTTSSRDIGQLDLPEGVMQQVREAMA